VELGDREPNSDAWRSIERAANGQPSSMQDVGVDHRRPHALVPKQFLRRADVIVALQQVRGKAVAEGVATDTLFNAGLLGGLSAAPLARNPASGCKQMLAWPARLEDCE